jgi:hypothetical protein
MTISRRLKIACLVSVFCAFTLTACPTGQGTSGNYGATQSNGTSLGAPGTASSGAMGSAAGGGAEAGGAPATGAGATGGAGAGGASGGR